ncbi:MAG: hypothetical protein POELPBGB_03896 [Bacteroidia bacterium]|nr:hypothetical protein [Bacteroidia bacterium]
MAQGIVKSTPRPGVAGSTGTLQLSTLDSTATSYKLTTSSVLSFTQTGFAVGDTVNCTVDSTSACTVTGKVAATK